MFDCYKVFIRKYFRRMPFEKSLQRRANPIETKLTDCRNTSYHDCGGLNKYKIHKKFSNSFKAFTFDELEINL